MLAERDPAAAGAWHTLFDQVTSTLGSRSRARTARSTSCSRSCATTGASTRIAAYEALFAALEPHTADARARLRHARRRPPGAGPRARLRAPARARATSTTSCRRAAVDAMLDAVERHHPSPTAGSAPRPSCSGSTSSRWPTSTRRSARRARSPTTRRPRSWRARSAASRRASSDVARGLYRDSRIDAEPRQGKRGGAFCASVAQDALPYILLNFTDQMDDVRTLAHELGHGMHFELAGERQTRALAPPAAGAGRGALDVRRDDRLRPPARGRRRQDPARLGAARVERRGRRSRRSSARRCMVRYEQGAYGLRAEGKALIPDRLGEFWLEAQPPYYGDAVELPEGYRFGWAYIPHFIHTRFYTYAYVFAHLASLALYAQLPRGRRRVRRPVPRLPRDRRRRLAAGAARGARPRHHARRRLGRGLRRDRAPGRDGRGDRAGLGGGAVPR